jgi:hypothetical protein
MTAKIEDLGKKPVVVITGEVKPIILLLMRGEFRWHWTFVRFGTGIIQWRACQPGGVRGAP